MENRGVERSPGGSGDFIPDCADPFPDSPQPCGDNDRDGYDDCTGDYVGDYYEDCCDEGGLIQDKRSGLCPAVVGGRTRVPHEPAWTLLLLLFFLRRRTAGKPWTSHEKAVALQAKHDTF